MITPNSHMNPVYGKEEIQSVTDYLNSGGWIMEHTKTRELEQMICDYTGATYAHMVPSATAGLLIAAMLANIQHGDQIAVSAWTQAATINGAISLGANPYIVDIDKCGVIEFGNIPDYVKIVFVTSINGRYSPDTIENIKRLRSNGVFVIEDAAQSLGSFTSEGHVGTIGDVGVFSFGAPKIITTGQGGCIVTNNKHLSNRISEIKNFGRSMGVLGETYNVLGLNFKFTDLQAAFGIEQMRKLPDIVKRKKRIYEIYQTELSEFVKFIDIDLSMTTPTYPDIYFETQKDRDTVVDILKQKNIGTRLVYSSLSSQPFHSRWARPTSNTDIYSRTGLQLPAQADLTDDDVYNIASVIKDYYKQKKYNPANNELLRLIKSTAYEKLDKLCFVLAGQPRYIGTTAWENNIVSMLKATVQEHQLEIDITYVLPEYDTLDKGFWGLDHSTNTGLPLQVTFNKDLDQMQVRKFFYTLNDDKTKTGKIKIKKTEIEKYIKEKLNFVDNITFVYYDPYKIVKEVEDLINYEILTNTHLYNLIDSKTHNIELDHVGWLTQHLSPQYAYTNRKDFFDNLSMNTPIFKMRHDYGFNRHLLTNKQSVTLWNLISIYFDGYLAFSNSIVRNNNTNNNTNNTVPVRPEVIYEAHQPEIIYGKLFSADFYHVFNKEGFKIYAEEFLDWLSENLIERSSGLLPEKIFKDEHKSYLSHERQIIRKPEVIINSFFMDKKFSMKYSGMHSNLLNFHEGAMIRKQTPMNDFYRQLWYEWSDEMIEQLKNIVNRSVYFD